MLDFAHAGEKPHGIMVSSPKSTGVLSDGAMLKLGRQSKLRLNWDLTSLIFLKVKRPHIL